MSFIQHLTTVFIAKHPKVIKSAFPTNENFVSWLKHINITKSALGEKNYMEKQKKVKLSC